jgi:hypothetical protein
MLNFLVSGAGAKEELEQLIFFLVGVRKQCFQRLSDLFEVFVGGRFERGATSG